MPHTGRSEESALLVPFRSPSESLSEGTKIPSHFQEKENLMVQTSRLNFD